MVMCSALPHAIRHRPPDEMEFCVWFHADGASHITLHFKKRLDWLYSLGSISLPEKQAWELCNSIYNRLFFGTEPQATALSDLRRFSPEQDLPASIAAQPMTSSGPEAKFKGGAAVTEQYMMLPHNVTVHPAIGTPYDEAATETGGMHSVLSCGTSMGSEEQPDSEQVLNLFLPGPLQ
jgi:hypothetical protein